VVFNKIPYRQVVTSRPFIGVASLGLGYLLGRRSRAADTRSARVAREIAAAADRDFASGVTNPHDLTALGLKYLRLAGYTLEREYDIPLIGQQDQFIATWTGSGDGPHADLI
jgi:hypothetical protein